MMMMMMMMIPDTMMMPISAGMKVATTPPQSEH